MFITTTVRPTPTPREASRSARLLGDDDDAVGQARRHALLELDQPDQRIARRAPELRGEQLREGVVDVEHDRRPLQAGHDAAAREEVGHVVRLDEVERRRALERRQLARAARRRRCSRQVGAVAAPRLCPAARGARGSARARDSPPARRGRPVDLVAALGQRPRLPLDARVEAEVRVVDHADAQRAWPRSGAHAATRSALPGERDRRAVAAQGRIGRLDARARSRARERRWSGAGAGADRAREVLRARGPAARAASMRGITTSPRAVGELVLAEARRRAVR